MKFLIKAVQSVELRRTCKEGRVKNFQWWKTSRCEHVEHENEPNWPRVNNALERELLCQSGFDFDLVHKNLIVTTHEYVWTQHNNNTMNLFRIWGHLLGKGNRKKSMWSTYPSHRANLRIDRQMTKSECSDKQKLTKRKGTIRHPWKVSLKVYFVRHAYM